jgi:N-glycosylase/DNA lyase
MAFHSVELSSANALSLRYTLPSGQCFRWKPLDEETWRGVMDSTIVTLRQRSPELLEFQTFPESDPALFKQFLAAYFRFDSVDLGHYFNQWGTYTPSDSNLPDINQTFADVSLSRSGLRLIRQEPYECTFSFICSQNNNIKRISGMIDRLCKSYGTSIGTLDGEEFFAFPTSDQLCKATEDELRDLGFGYRAKYIVAAAKLVKQNGGENWLRSLRDMSKEDAKKGLISLPGVGPKVADCISLFSLDHLDVVPVDTHVWQMAQKYMPHLAKDSTPSPKVFSEINAFFIEKFGDKAGWAHTVLFSAAITKELGLNKTKKAEKPKRVSKKREADDEDFELPVPKVPKLSE